MPGFIFYFAVNTEQELENQPFSLRRMSAKEFSVSESLLQEIWI